MLASTPDLLRLVAVPVLGWAALSDFRTRRVPNVLWYPLAGLGVLLLLWDLFGIVPPSSFGDRLFLVRVAISLGFVIPFSYLFWRLGGFGGADAKALMALAVLLPTTPTYFLPTTALPLVSAPLGVFSFTILTNTVVVAIVYPLGLGFRNLVTGDPAPVMFFGRCIDVSDLSTAYGRLFETSSGYTRAGLDIDALRMYLRWRGTTLDALRAAPDEHRDPASVDETYEPTDGRVFADGGEVFAADVDAETFDDPWAAARFLDSLEGTAYGTSPEMLREGLDLVVERDRVWISPGIPFLVPMFVGLVVAFVYGDILFGVLAALGLA